MIREEDLRELVEFDSEEQSVLSLYLNVDPRYRTTEQYKLALRSLFDKLTNGNHADRERVERFIDLEYDRQGRAVVCYSCQARDFWRAYVFNVPVDDAVMLDRRPLVRRLVDLIDTYGYLGVVNVDSRGARFFSFHLGGLEEAEGTVGEDVKRHKQGGWAAARYQRHEDEAARNNLRRVAELTEQYHRQYDWRRLVIAGTDANVSQFLELLPAHVRKLVVGTTPLELTATPQEVRERAETIALNARADFNEQLAADLIVAASKGANAVMDLAPTLDALQSGRLYQLLFSETYEIAEGSVQRCHACGFLSVDSGAICPICSGSNEPLPDAINTIARRAIAQDAQVIVLPAHNPLSAQGHAIGAYLRF